MAVSIMDVARFAKVSPATVSYVLTGKKPISHATRSRVLEAVETLGYAPNRHARALRSNRHGTIGLLVADVTEPMVPQVLSGIERAVFENDYSLVVSSVGASGGDLQAAAIQIAEKGLDGLLCLSGISSDKASLTELPIATPVVGINRPLVSSSPSILFDDYRGGYDGAAHLLDRGAQRPAIITGPGKRHSSIRRLEGFRDMLSERSIKLPAHRIVQGSYESENGYEGLRQILQREKSGTRTDGVFCENDNIAAGALNAAAELGVPVPEGLRVVGFDDKEFASFWNIPITTFRRPLQEMGYRAGTILFQLIEGTETHETEIRLRSQLIRRRSS